ncbi:hypothetical protein [Taibaiella koreensis]|uniref:hypothetical protein n=1 Tax=Taibaiella koreensis TaxID=1268548 RepID=UPI000E5995BD|nr:hypothetical protein [Taibaiella koreensis]
MILLPAEHISFKTSLGKEEVLQRLTTMLTPPPHSSRSFWGGFSGAAYKGKIAMDGFAISREIRYRNSFLPRISGKIYTDVDGATIEVRMRLHPLVLAFICIWALGVGFAAIAALSAGGPAAFIPAAMLLFLYVLVMGAFKFESRRSIDDLRTLWEATVVRPGNT